MLIAVTFDNDEIYKDFKNTPYFKFYEVEEGEIEEERIVSSPTKDQTELSYFLEDEDVDILICGEIGNDAVAYLASAGIMIYGGIEGKADKAVKKLIKGTLNFKPNSGELYPGNGANPLF